MNKIKDKFWNLKIAPQSSKTPYALCAKKLHGKFSHCFNRNLISWGYLHSLNFIGWLFRKILSLKFNDFITYFWVFTFGVKREIPLLSEYGMFFTLYIFHMKLGLSLFSDLYISMARNCKCLWWIFTLLSEAKSSSYVAMQLLYTTYKVLFCTFSAVCILFFEQIIQINEEFANWLSIIK